MMRFAGMAVAFALSACVVPVDVHDGEKETQRRRAASRHMQLSLAYLAAQRLDVAESEAAAARQLLPGDVAALHLSALVDVAAGRSACALERFAAAVAIDDAASAIRLDDTDGLTSSRAGILADRRALWSNYARALCGAGRAADAGRFFERSRRQMLQEGVVNNEQCRQAS